jgi:hypothetical protein
VADLTPEARIHRAEQVVREQRDPDGEYAGLHCVPESVVEAMAIQELERLQRAVMGQPEPRSNAEADLASWPRHADGQTLRIPRPA